MTNQTSPKEQVKKDAKGSVGTEAAATWESLRAKMNPASVQVISKIIYRDLYRFMSIAFLLTLGVLVFYIVFDKATEKEVQNNYFAQKPDGQITELTPLSDPNLSDPAIKNWATNITPEIYSFTFKNYKEHFNKVGGLHFTKNGFLALNNALRAGDPSTLDIVLDRKYVVTTTLAGKQAVIEKAGQLGGAWAWQVAIPVIINYVNLKEDINNTRLVRLTIVRSAGNESPHGISISKFIVGRYEE